MLNDENIEDQYVILREGVLRPEYSDITWRTVLATGGFGCSPNTSGRAVFVEFVRDGEQTRYNRGDIERLAAPDEVEAAQALADA